MATRWWQINRWFTSGDKAREAFGWVVRTPTGKMFDQIDDIFQPAADDIRGWKRIQDIGKFSDSTMTEFYEAWQSVPTDMKKQVIKLLKKLSSLVDPKTLVALIEVYLRNASRLSDLIEQ